MFDLFESSVHYLDIEETGVMDLVEAVAASSKSQTQRIEDAWFLDFYDAGQADILDEKPRTRRNGMEWGGLQRTE